MRLRERPNVHKVTRQCDVLGGEQPSIEWHVDADLSTNDSISWRLHLHWSGEAWVIETDIRRVHPGGSGSEADFDAQTISDAELDAHLREASAQLVRAHPEPG